MHANYNQFLQCKLADRLGRWAAVGSFTGRSVSSGYLEFLNAVQHEASRTLPAPERAALETYTQKVKRLRDDAYNLENKISLRWSHHRRDMDAGRVPLATHGVRKSSTASPCCGLRSRAKSQMRSAATTSSSSASAAMSPWSATL